MRIIFTKKRLNKKTSLVNEFKKLIQKVDITNGADDWMSAFTL